MVPNCLVDYIERLYGRLQGHVTGPSWESESFNFRKGVFQGDPLSPVIFLACFNPLLEYLTSIKTKYGYDLNGEKIISTPYADDFNLISNNKRSHQKIISQLNSHCQSMGLSLKPAKCRSLSICSGTPLDITFHIGNTDIESLKMGAHKFLGSQIFFSGKTNEVFDYVKTEISSKMKNIDQSLVRPEYKVSIYVRYLLPALRFMMSVHTMHKSHLDVLDTMTDGYLKKWLGIPSRGANIAVVHLPQGMGIPRFSDVYWKANCSAYSRSRLVGDELVKHALDSTLERESKWTTKQSTVTVCHDVHEKVVEERGANVGSWATWKKKISNIIEDNAIVYWKEKIEPLLCQGKFAELLITENENLTWKSIMFNLPRKALKFAINACIDLLPSYAKLSRWD